MEAEASALEISPSEPIEPGHGFVKRADLARIGFVAVGLLAGRLGAWRPFFGFDALSLLAALVGGYPIFREAGLALRRWQMTMELSMSIAVLAALAIGEFFTGAVIVLFVLVAEVLEGLTVGRGRSAIADLLPLLPDIAFLRDGPATRKVSTADLRPGDVIQIKPGSRIPVDGVVVRGHSFVEQAAITGESLPSEKVPGTPVYAGTVNQSGALDIEVSGIAGKTVFAGILRTVEEARRSKAPVQRLADRLAGYLVFFALASSLVTLAITRDVRASIAVVIVAGACGVAAGTPLALLGAIGRGARLGCIVRNAEAVEQLGRVDTIVLDKTGTLTLGSPRVAAVRPAPGVTERQVLEAASSAERPSEHPLAEAVLTAAREAGVDAAEPETFSYRPGAGIRCTLRGEEILVGTAAWLENHRVSAAAAAPGLRMLVARGGLLLGGLEIADAVRPQARAAVREFRRMGILTLLFTGDTREQANAVALPLGVDQVEAELLPQDKLSAILELKGTGRHVAMVGDGINDAPALAGADVGVAMGSGTDVARESADAVLLGNDLYRLAATVRVARTCRAIIFQNFGGTIAVDLAGIALAAAGRLTPVWAAAIHVTSELLFLANSARLLPRGRLTLRPAEEPPPDRRPIENTIQTL